MEKHIADTDIALCHWPYCRARQECATRVLFMTSERIKVLTLRSPLMDLNNDLQKKAANSAISFTQLFTQKLTKIASNWPTHFFWSKVSKLI